MRGAAGNPWSSETMDMKDHHKERRAEQRTQRTKCLFSHPENELSGPCLERASQHWAPGGSWARRPRRRYKEGESLLWLQGASRIPKGVHSPHIYLCELKMLMSVVEPRALLGFGSNWPYS